VPASPENSSTRSKPGSKSSEEAANLSADRAFFKKAAVGAAAEGSSPRRLEARRTSGGAFFIRTTTSAPSGAASKDDGQGDSPGVDRIRPHLGIIQPITVRYVRETMCIKSSQERPITSQPRKPVGGDSMLGTKPATRKLFDRWWKLAGADLIRSYWLDTLVQLRDGLGYSQKRIADLRAKRGSEISKILSLLKLRRQSKRSSGMTPPAR